MATKQVVYDPRLIETFAGKLYEQAASIVSTWTLLGALFGGVFGLLAGARFGSELLGAGLAAIVAGGIGYTLAQPRAFLLKLQAQQALCQVRIEANTRPPSA